ncbi:MAG: fructose-6-phosphate aldolase [Candidatus Aminicenantia bacterium]
MKIFLDTANIEEIKEGVSMGLVDGVTTNPTLISREKGSFREIIENICKIVNGPVSVEVVSEKEDDIVKEAKEHSKIAENVVVKIPINPEGLKAIKRLSQENIKTNATLVFSPSQALLAAKAGAKYVSPFIGRIDDISWDGMELIEKIMIIFENYGFGTEVIVASVRHPMHVVESALIGAPIVTMPFSVFKALFKHPLTDIGIERFQKDWESFIKR